MMPGYVPEGVGDVRAINLMPAQLQTGRVSAWRVAPAEVIGAGLAFGVQGTGPIPARIERWWRVVGAGMFEELAGHQNPLESRRNCRRGARMARGIDLDRPGALRSDRSWVAEMVLTRPASRLRTAGRGFTASC
jgi:hypothetical protein